ncbi:RHS repeat domain-containing protein [Luteimonas salinilitoris]
MVKQFTNNNGVVHTTAQNVRGLPSRIRDAGTNVYVDEGYDYDGNGNVAAISDGRAGHRSDRTMQYDALDRLTQVVSPMFGTAAYEYDLFDNLKRVRVGATAMRPARDHTYQYNAQNRLNRIVNTSGGAEVTSLSYDNRGNVAARTGASFSFDSGNRLRSANQNGTASSYVYDGHGRRVRDVTGASKYSQYNVNGQLMYVNSLRSNQREWHIYLGSRLVAIRQQNTSTGSTATQYQHLDALGSVVARSNSGSAIYSEYEPYGALSNRANHDRPAYTGHVQDAATGLTYMQQRYYDPQLGLFLSVDPVTALSNPVGQFHRYRYANNNPYKFVDPDGRRACGKDWDCRMAQHNGGVSFSRGELNAARKNPDRFISRLNDIPNSQRTEQGSGRYFARSAMPVTIATGREVGADIVNRGAGGKPFSVVNFVLGDPARGDGSGSVTQGQKYNGLGVRVAIAHTHPINNAFSGWRGCHCNGGWRGGFIRGDLERALSADANAYLATPNGALMRFDLQSMKEDVARSPDAYISASSYFSISP